MITPRFTVRDHLVGALRAGRRLVRREIAAAHARRLRLKFSFPTARRVNLTVIYDGEGGGGPYAVRAHLLEGSAQLTRDSVDGLPDGEDPSEVVAPMTRAPAFGEDVHRIEGAIGIEARRGEPHGAIEVEIIDTLGRLRAAVRRRF